MKPQSSLFAVLIGLFVAFDRATSQETTYPKFVDFRVLSYSKFTCQAKGFRCGYIKDQFGNYQMTSDSQDSVGAIGGEGNNIWSNVGSVNDSLILTDCKIDYCFVRCNYGCDCVLEDGNTTCEAGTAPPSPAPPTDPPAVCPEQINTQYCPDMITNAPAGTQYDCYNFCGGNFVSTCDFGGTCASYSCSNQGAVGSPTGLVVGCTRDMLNGNFQTANGGAPSPTTTGTTGSGTTSGTSLSNLVLMKAGAVLGLVTMLVNL